MRPLRVEIVHHPYYVVSRDVIRILCWNMDHPFYLIGRMAMSVTDVGGDRPPFSFNDQPNQLVVGGRMTFISWYRIDRVTEIGLEAIRASSDSSLAVQGAGDWLEAGRKARQAWSAYTEAYGSLDWREREIVRERLLALQD